MEPKVVHLTVALMALVTLIPRLIPFAVLGNREIPRPWIAWLSYVPAALIAAMLAPQILVSAGKLNFSAGNLYLLASIPTFMVGWLTKNIFLTVMAGMSALAVLRLVGA